MNDKRMNMMRGSPSFVLRQTGEDGSADVLKPERVPANDGIYWVAGTTVLKSGRELSSVFCVDTDSGGELLAAFWWIDGKWYSQQDDATLRALGLSRSEVFPYDWRYHVPLTEDIYHD
jgi:hypothetical protein